MKIETRTETGEIEVSPEGYELAQMAVIKRIKNDALRAEIYAVVSNKSIPSIDEDLSMVHVHEILDALVEVLER